MALIDNLISYWSLDGDSTDAHASADGTDTSVAYSTSYGKVDEGVRFDQTPGSPGTATDYVTIGAPFTPGTSDISFSLWFNPETVNTITQAVWYWEQSNANGFPHWSMSFTSSGISVTCYNGAAQSHSVSTGVVPSASTWYHVVFTRTASDKIGRAYINNSSEYASAAATTNANLAITSNLLFGRRFNPTYSNEQYPYDGYLDEVGVWDKVLTTDEISALYNDGDGLAYPLEEGGAGAGFLAANLALKGVG